MLTAIILTKNEQENIERCLASVKFCDSVVVVDDGSTDDTVKKAKKAGATILKHELKGDYGAARNWALEQVKSHWVLFVDADEVVSAALAGQIKAAVEKIEYRGFFLHRVDHLWGQELKHGDVGNVQLLRLGRRGMGHWEGRVHETWSIEGKVGTLTAPLEHYPHASVVEFLDHLNDYSTVKAEEFFKAGRQTNIFEITLGPIWRFFQAYILRFGFLDGTAGFVHAMLMAMYMFLVAGKLYLLGRGIHD
jgi:glycosyltransferase involved in cell wall biosynthesis